MQNLGEGRYEYSGKMVSLLHTGTMEILKPLIRTKEQNLR